MPYDIPFLMRKGWHEDDHLIICYPWLPWHDGEKFPCDLCEKPVSAYPVTIKKVKEDNTWHIICMDCRDEIGKLHKCAPGGRVTDNKIIHFD